MTLDELRVLVAGYCASVRESHTFTAETLRQSDSLLNWTVGLMGAGLFATPTFLSSVGVSLGSHRVALLLVLLPWGLGILCGVAGRILALELREADNLHIGSKLHAIEALTLNPARNADQAGTEFFDILNDVGVHGRLLARVKRFQWWTRVFYYSVYVALGLGTISVFSLASLGERILIYL